MKIPYKIIDVNNELVVLPVSNVRLDEICNRLVIKLHKKHFSGKVFFDLLISNGLSSNRFICIQFTKDKFDFSSAKELKNATNEISKLSNNFYSKKREFILESILSRTEKKRVIDYLESQPILRTK